jgi:hypothetical protein
MAKLKSPLLSLKAWGQVTKDIIIRRARSGTIAERKPMPTDAKSPAQLAQRTLFQQCSEEWKLMTPAEKVVYERYGTEHHMTGYAWFMRAFLLNPAPRNFIQLEDCPASYAGQAAKLPAVKGDESGLEFIATPAPDFPQKLKPAITRYVIPGWYFASNASISVEAGYIYYIPIFVSETTTFTAICTRVRTQIAGTARLGIFNWSNGLPGTKILDAGTVDTSTTGVKSIIINQVLTRGYYFLAIRCSATPSLDGPATTYAISTPVQGIGDGSNILPLYPILAAIAAWADPAPAPTSARDAGLCVVFLKET